MPNVKPRFNAETTPERLRQGRSAVRRSPSRLRPRLLPILQTALAATVAWYLAELLLDDEQPAFASIAAVISLGATFGERRKRAFQLVAGVVVGITLADLIIQVIGTGPPQIGVMVMLAMSAAVLLGGGELVVAEAAVSAVLLVALGPSGDSGFLTNRVIEAVIGGGVALIVASFFFPPDPRLLVDRPVQALFALLGRTLELIVDALERHDPEAAGRAVDSATRLDDYVDDVREALETARETARFSPPRRGARGELEPFVRSVAQLDFAVRDTRVLARHVLRYVRGEGVAPPALARAVGDLASAVWALAAAYDDPDRTEEVHRLAVAAAARGAEILERSRDLALSEIVAQLRSTAVDLVRAAELVAGAPDPGDEIPTKELLTVAPADLED